MGCWLPTPGSILNQNPADLGIPNRFGKIRSGSSSHDRQGDTLFQSRQVTRAGEYTFGIEGPDTSGSPIPEKSGHIESMARILGHLGLSKNSPTMTSTASGPTSTVVCMSPAC